MESMFLLQPEGGQAGCGPRVDFTVGQWCLGAMLGDRPSPDPSQQTQQSHGLYLTSLQVWLVMPSLGKCPVKDVKLTKQWSTGYRAGMPFKRSILKVNRVAGC